MNSAPTPAAKAEQVLASMGITDPPALHLEEIAKSQNIRVGKKELPDDPNLSGLLLFRGEKRAILINTFIHNTGRINFTFAHELGHHFCSIPQLISLMGGRAFAARQRICKPAFIPKKQKPIVLHQHC